MIKRFIEEVLNSVDNKNNRLEINVLYKSDFNQKQKMIEFYISSNPIKNPIINFLHRFLKHKNIFKKFRIKINFVINQCMKCKENHFMSSEPGCLGSGRYCLNDKNFK